MDHQDSNNANAEQPVDAFANLDLSIFNQRPTTAQALQERAAPIKPNPKAAEATQPVTQANVDMRSDEREMIRQVAAEYDFTPRYEEPKPKPKATAKSFSLFPQEHHIIHQALLAYLQSGEATLLKASGSDVVRAALYELAQHSPDEQARLIAKYRGRGRA